MMFFLNAFLVARLLFHPSLSPSPHLSPFLLSSSVQLFYGAFFASLCIVKNAFKAFNFFCSLGERFLMGRGESEQLRKKANHTHTHTHADTGTHIPLSLSL